VDIFFLISGHFLIKITKQSIVKFVLTVLFFNIINIALVIISGGNVNILGLIAAFIFPISKSPYWFIHVYFLLMISSPIVNIGLKVLSRRQLLMTMSIFVLCAVMWRGYEFNYSYLNGLLLYCLGYTLRTFNVATLFKQRTLLCMCGAVLLSASIISYSLTTFSDSFFESYTNVFTILSAVLLYLYFSKLEFRNRAVNSLATAALGCYLLQDGRFGSDFFYNYQHSYMLSHGYGFELFVMFAASFIGFWVLSFLLTKFKDLWIGRACDFIIAVGDKLVLIFESWMRHFISRANVPKS
jgi:hypothetical protein